MKRIAVIGAGAWGTTLALSALRAARGPREVMLWAHEPEVVTAVNEAHENPLFLPGVGLDPAITATNDPAVVEEADAVLLVTPAQFLRRVSERVAAHWPARAPAVICAKGIEQGTSALMTEVAAEILPEVPVAVLSGPTFAAEVARDLPTAVTLACADAATGRRLIETLGTARFRIYSSEDVVGAEIGGAVKNVLAIACGIVEGRGLGDNARAALITRGLAEIVRLGLAKGAKMETLMGLSGIGDLTLTCSSPQSRNMSLGIALGNGRSLEEIVAGRAAVAEGRFSAPSIAALAKRLSVEMPIVTAVDAVLAGRATIDEAIEDLLARPFRDEAAGGPASS